MCAIYSGARGARGDGGVDRRDVSDDKEGGYPARGSREEEGRGCEIAAGRGCEMSDDLKAEAGERAKNLGLTLEAMRAAGLRAAVVCESLAEAAVWVNEPAGLLLGQRGSSYLVGLVTVSAGGAE